MRISEAKAILHRQTSIVKAVHRAITMWIPPVVTQPPATGALPGAATHLRQSATSTALTNTGSSNTGSAVLAHPPVAGVGLVSIIAVDKDHGGTLTAPSGWTLGGTWRGTTGVSLGIAYKAYAVASDRTATWSWASGSGASIIIAETLVKDFAVDGSPVVSGTESSVTSFSVTSPAPGSGVVLRILGGAIDSASGSDGKWANPGPSWNGGAVSRVTQYGFGTGSQDNGTVAATLATATIPDSNAATLSLLAGSADQMAAGVFKVKGTLVEAAPAVTRDSVVYGRDMPNDSTVGVPSGTTLTDSDDTTSAQFMDTVGATYQNMRFLRRVTVRARGVTFINCVFVGGATPHTSDSGLVTITDASLYGSTQAERTKFYDCTFYQRSPGNRINAILGWHFEMYRCDVYFCVDGVGVHGYNWWNANGRPNSYPSGVVVKGCRFWKPYFDTATYQSDGFTHNDVGMQVQGGDDGEFIGNLVIAYRATTMGYQADVVGTGGNASYIGGRVLSCVLFGDEVGIPNGWKVQQNWFEGAHLAAQLGSTTTSLTFTGQRFDGTSSGRDFNTDNTAAARPNVVLSDNLRYDGSVANIRRG